MPDDAEATMDDVRTAEKVLHRFLSPAPLIRSYRLEQSLGLPEGRRVWVKDYGWTPVGSFKVFGALNWMYQNGKRIGDRTVVAHSSGNFASGLAYAGRQLGKRVIIVMPESAPRVKFELTKSFGAEIRTYDITTDHLTGARDRLAREIAENERAIEASPYDDNDVIAGNGVGAFEIAHVLRSRHRTVSHFVCPVSGGGLMAGHALVMADAFPQVEIIGVEPAGADDFRQSLASGKRLRIDQPTSICDGLLSYDVGLHNWPILSRLVTSSLAIPDDQTRRAMRWLYDQHGLRTEPSGAIAVASLLGGHVHLDGEGDVVVIISGRNIDEDRFRAWIA